MCSAALPVVRRADHEDPRAVALGELVGEVCPALGIPDGRGCASGVVLGVPGPRRDRDQEAPVAEPCPVEYLLGPPPRLRTRLEHGAVELLMDARDLGEAQPRLRLVLPAPGPDATGEEEPDTAADPTALGDAGKVRGGRRRDARGAEEDGVEPQPAQRRPEAQTSGSPAPEPCKRDDLVDRRDAVGQVDRGRGADERDSCSGVAGPERTQQRRRLQGFGHPAVHDDRNIHAQTV